MIIASQKRKENIAEYLIYMWQIEDIIRANNLDIERIKENVIDRFNLDDNKQRDSIEGIYYYRNHRLIKSVDFKDDEIPHAHYWTSGMVGRKRHDKRNIFELNDRDKRLMKISKGFHLKKL